MATNTIEITTADGTYGIRPNRAGGYTIEGPGKRDAADSLAAAVGKVLDSTIPADERAHFLGGILALRDECARLTEDNVHARQSIMALEKRCATLEDERDRYFNMKRETAGRFADERARRHNVLEPALRLSVNLIRGLVEQQAMDDDWYVNDLEKILEALGDGKDQAPAS